MARSEARPASNLPERENAAMDRSDRTLADALREHLRQSTHEDVTLVETHISWVLLTRQWAWKLKKPVRLPFVDFSTAAARAHFCREELRLNRRFAPSLYLGVLPVYGTPEAPRLAARDLHEAPIDHLVCMRRFPESAVLRSLLRAPAFDAAPLDRFAARLAAWHAQAARAAPASPFGEPGLVAAAAARVAAQLAPEPRLDALQRWLEARSTALRGLWAERRAQGAVRECHGDLHAANIVRIDGELLPFDCIEFDPALRWIDVQADLAFLTMDLKASGRPDLAFRVLDAWLQHSGDYAGLPALPFHEVCRALVRALAARLGPHAEAPDYMACATRLAQGAEGGARLMITHGLSGSGKSSLAAQLLEHAHAVRVRSDVERKRLFGLDALARSAAHGVDIYTPEANRDTFERLRVCAQAGLGAGYPVIVDAAFLRAGERARFEQLASGLGVPFAILDCQAPEPVLRERVRRRAAGAADASEADPGVLALQIARREPLDAHERSLAIEVRTDQAVDLAAIDARWRAAPVPRIQRPST